MLAMAKMFSKETSKPIVINIHHTNIISGAKVLK